MREILGCCHRFKDCSDAGRCVHEIDTSLHGILDYEKCLYKVNIDMGLNFYTEYNENNKARAEEYKAKNEKKVDDATSVPIQSNKTYIEIFNRLFSIGNRSSYNGYTYNLSAEDKELVSSIINKHGISCTNIKDSDKFIDEVPGDDEYCNCKVIITLGGQKYNISNYNDRGLTKKTAIGIVEFLILNNIDAEIEKIKNFSDRKIPEKSNIARNNLTKDKEVTSKTNYGQISLFDML